MILLRLAVLGLSAALLLSACGRADDGPRATRVTADEAAEGAALLGLEEPGRARWAERSFSGGTYRFTGFTLRLDDGEDEEGGLAVTADVMEIASPRLEDGIVRFDRMVMENGTLPAGNDGASARFERLVIDRPGPELSRSVAASFTGADEALPDIAGNLDAYSFRELSLTGFSMSGGEFDGVMQISSLVLERLDAGGLESARIEGLRLDAHADDGLSLAIEEARLEGAGARFIAALLAGEAANPLNLAVSANPADFYREMQLSGLSGTVSGLAFSLEEFTTHVSETREGIRTRIRMPDMTLRARPNSDAGAQIEGGLAILGFEEVVLSFESDAVYDPATDRARTQNTNRFIWRDGLTLDFHQELSGVEAYGSAVAAAQAAGKANETVVEGLDRLLMLHRLELRLEDQSLLERSFTAYGAMMGVTPDQMRLQASALVTLGLSAAPREVPRSFLNAIARPLSEFVRDGGTLVLTLDPPQPVPMNALTSPSGDFDIDRLGLSVRVERSN
ncbi:MAG: hypothetical protein ACK4NO_05620 [Glycocaulis sp.]